MSAEEHYIGQRRSYDSHLCTVRYIGEVAGTKGAWLGVEWDDVARGKHDGGHKGVKYFSCTNIFTPPHGSLLTVVTWNGLTGSAGISKSPTAASFVRPNRPADRPRSLVSAVNEKYASEVTNGHASAASAARIEISGKVVEEVGFDKIRQLLAKVQDLKIVILDGMCVDHVVSDGEKSIKETCPNIRDLDLSRNLFEEFSPVAEICKELPSLRSLKLRLDIPMHIAFFLLFFSLFFFFLSISKHTF
jgi:tubulin-specific chaperone E